jgi:hypothetical protein
VTGVEGFAFPPEERGKVRFLRLDAQYRLAQEKAQ